MTILIDKEVTTPINPTSKKIELKINTEFRTQLDTDIKLINFSFSELMSDYNLEKRTTTDFLFYINTIIKNLSYFDNEISMDYLFEKISMHKNPYIRMEGVKLATKYLPHQIGIDAICYFIHDPDDIVFIPAIKAAGNYRIEEALNHLHPLVGYGSSFFKQGIKLPVGMGHAYVAEAMEKIYGTDNYEEVKKLEEVFLETGKLFEYKSDDLNRATLPNLERMVLIPSGSFLMGVDSDGVTGHRLSMTGASPQQKVFENAFYIDEYPVTNQEYDEFVEDTKDDDSLYRHPDQNKNKPHMRNTYYNPKFCPDHPVTGIDWYDAYCYAKWAGKDLPTESQWEKAARGTRGNIYPWGNDFRKDFVVGFEDTDATLTEWRQCLCSTSNIYHSSTTTYSIYSKEGNVSPFGVKDMVGNAWEYTKTNFYSGEDMDPEFEGLDVSEFLQEEEGYPVIKGGAWTSIPDMISTWFRGKDLLTDRHSEIGFRCVKNIKL